MGELRDAFRALRSTPLVTATAVLSLALGIGANTAIFSLLNAALLRPLPITDPERLVVVSSADERRSAWLQPVDVVVERVSIRHPPPDWIERPDATRVLGDTWLAEGRSLLLAVPSALVPETFNLLLNPDHADAGRVGIAASSDHVIDPRLLKGSRSILPPR